MSKCLPLIVLLSFSAHAFAQAPPGAPQNLTQGVSGTTVTLNWGAPSTGGVPTSYVVEASVVPGGAVVASLPVSGTSLTVPNVPPGVYFVRVRAVNAGGQSAPSNEVTVTVGGSGGGCPAPPLPPQLIVRATGFAVTLGWTSPGGCAPTSYVVLAGSGPGLSNIAQANMGAQTGLGATAPAGVYFIRVVATNAFGSTSSEERMARVASNAVTDTLSPLQAVFFPITVSSTGTYRATLEWLDPTLNLDFYLTTSTCGYPPTGCTLAASSGVGVNQEQVSLSVVAGQSYRLWVDNFTNRSTSFTISSLIQP